MAIVNLRMRPKGRSEYIMRNVWVSNHVLQMDLAEIKYDWENSIDDGRNRSVWPLLRWPVTRNKRRIKPILLIHVTAYNDSLCESDRLL